MANLPVSVWIGNAAAVMAGVWGAVTQRTRESGCSRQTVYEHAKRVERLVMEDQQGGPRREELFAENQRLREENQVLWESLAEMIEFPKTKQQQFAATACAMGFSLTQIRELLGLLMEGRTAPSRATLERWSQSCARRAGDLLRELALPTAGTPRQSGGRAGASGVGQGRKGVWQS